MHHATCDAAACTLLIFRVYSSEVKRMVGILSKKWRLVCCILFSALALLLLSAPTQATPLLWFDGDQPRVVTLAADELVLFPGHLPRPQQRVGEFWPGAVVVAERLGQLHLRLPEVAQERRLQALNRQLAATQTRLARVFYRFGEEREPGLAYLLGEELLIHFHHPHSRAEATAWGEARGLELLADSGMDHAFRFACGEALACIEQAAAAYLLPEVRYAYPNWSRPRDHRYLVPDDPRYPEQWNLHNSGQRSATPGADLNLLPAWQISQGAGVVIAMVDDGMELVHEDLAPNVLPGVSYNYLNGSSDPGAGGHGTHCAGVAAARGWNGLGGVGVAPAAGLVAFNLLAALSDANEADALSRAQDVVAISSNSWGPTDALAFLEGPGPLAQAALAAGVSDGRGGLGTVYVWAAGNGGDRDNANLDGYANSRYTLAIAASDQHGRRSDYSEQGANLHLNAPVGTRTFGVLTTAVNNQYIENFAGTSAAAPTVAGVVALLLAANPQLSWRDLIAILLLSAERNHPEEGDWVQNAAGHWVNHKYGFGRVDAAAALALAAHWQPLPEERRVEQQRTPALPIPDNDPIGVSDSLWIEESLLIESVDLYFTSNHPRGGQLEILLYSPSGTESLLAPVLSGNRRRYENWRFGVTRLFGEASQGEWTLVVRDKISGEVGQLVEWSLVIHGTAFDPQRDSDGDGIPDWWEIEHGLNPYDPSDALLDLDGDGYRNLYEYLGGSDPNDPESTPQHPPCSGDQVTLPVPPEQVLRHSANGRILCFASELLHSAGDVVVESGADIYYIAPTIRLSPGFRVEAGGRFTAISDQAAGP